MRKTIMVLTIACCCCATSFAQEYFSSGPFSHLGIAIKASTLGAGLEATTPLSRNLNLRAGFDWASYSPNFTIGMTDETLYDYLGYDPDYKMEAKLSFFSGHALVDLYPVKNGIFHFTTGLYVGSNKVKANGRIVDPQTGEKPQLPPGYSWDDITLKMDKYDITVENGEIAGDLKLGGAVKPYLGIGIGRSLPLKRIGFMFELGALYQGNVKVMQNGREVRPNATGEDSFGEDFHQAKKWLKWWPMINFQLTYRIF